MTRAPRPPRPFDEALIDRLRLSPPIGWKLATARGLLHAIDMVGRLARGAPFFGLKECEAVLVELREYAGADLIRALMATNNGTEITAHGLENVPTAGPVMVASTHATGLFDVVAQADALMAKRPDLKVVANEDAERFLGSDLTIPVRIGSGERNKATHETRAAMVRHLDAGGALMIFGSGRVARLQNGRLVESDWRSGPTRISQTTGVPIVPTSVNARNSDAYYATRRLVRWITRGNDDLAARIASMRHAEELRLKLGGRFEVYYGAPLPPGTPAAELKARAEALAPGLYARAP